MEEPKTSEKREGSGGKFRLQAKAVEIIYDGHIDGDEVFNMCLQYSQGLYKGFVKWHRGDNSNHTHCGILLLQKPDIKDAYKHFTLNGLRPSRLNNLGKGKLSGLKKLNTYVTYLCDGHDNGTYEDTWNYKYDHELLSTRGIIGRTVLRLQRGLHYCEIYKAAKWDERAELTKNKKAILSAYREYLAIMEHPPMKELRRWQTEAVERLFAQTDRQILWIYESVGNVGKTLLAKELMLHHGAVMFNNSGKKDLAYAYNGEAIVAFNLTRTNCGRINYESMESLKDGIMFSGKYESAAKVFVPPKVVVFSNSPPDYTTLSIDRWDVCTISAETGGLTQCPPPPANQDDNPCNHSSVFMCSRCC